MTAQTPSTKTHSIAIIQSFVLVCTGWFFYSLTDATTKILIFQNYPEAQIFLIRGLISVVLTSCIIGVGHGISGFLTPFWKLHSIRALVTGLNTYCVLKPLETIPLADFYGYVFLTPLLVSLLSKIILKETIAFTNFFCLGLGLLGVIVITKAQYAIFEPGVVFAFMVPLLVSVDILIVRKLAKERSGFLFVLFPSLAVLLLSLFLMPHSELAPIDKASDWGAFIGMPLSMIVGFWILPKGIARARKVVAVAPLQYSQIIYGIILGIIFFRDYPGLDVLAGAALVILSGVILVRYEKSTNGTNSH